MTLNIDLKPNERIIIANVSVRNGDRRARLTFETEAKFLREKDLLPASEAKTACEHLYILLQMIYFLENSPDLENRFVVLSNKIVAVSPSMAPFIAAIYDKFSSGEYYDSLKLGKILIKYEKELLCRLAVVQD